MPSQVRLFVSGGPDQEPVRELLGRALAELPINVGWVIKRTPDVDSVAETHLFMLLLGGDIWAPVGLELWWARRTAKPVLAYRTDGIHTPAGQVFLQDNADLHWTVFHDMVQFRRAVVRDLGRFLLEQPDTYGLTLPEIEALTGYLGGLAKSEPAPAPAKARGAGGGGVILAPGKDQPPGARLIDGD